jgi:hypothetical protein
MKSEMTVGHLLGWRLAQAEAEAPAAPRGAKLIHLTRPWWEIWPERFQFLVERLGRMQVAYGHAMAEPGQSRGGYPIPTLIVRVAEEREVFARVLYLCVRDGRLRLRFQLDRAPEKADRSYDVTIVCNTSQRPVICTSASLSVDNEYRIDAELSDELARSWEHLKVTDRMPFRLILRAEETNV